MYTSMLKIVPVLGYMYVYFPPVLRASLASLQRCWYYRTVVLLQVVRVLHQVQYPGTVVQKQCEGFSGANLANGKFVNLRPTLTHNSYVITQHLRF